MNTHTEPTISKSGNKTIVYNENKHLAVSSSRNGRHRRLVPEAGTRVSARCPLGDAPRHQHGLIQGELAADKSLASLPDVLPGPAAASAFPIHSTGYPPR